MPKIRCFCVFECAGTDIKEMDKNHGKQTNTSTGNGKEIKSRGREKFGLYLSSKVKSSPLSIKYLHDKPLDQVY